MSSPFDVPARTPLRVAITKGAYGDEYAAEPERMYQEAHPDAEIEHVGTWRIDEALEPLFAAGNPPDVVTSAGANTLNIGQLITDGELLDLAPVLDAPSYDDPARTVRETLLPSVVAAGTHNGTCYTMNYTYNVYGLWYSQSLFAERGWSYPRTWADMLDLCAEIKASGMAPWTYPGQFGQYMVWPMLAMAAKAAGERVLVDIDNLVPNAWHADGVRAAAEAFAELGRRGYILEGTEARDHIESESQWLAGNAAFVPAGNWVENEMRAETPPGFAMAQAPVPSLGPDDALPFDAVVAPVAEPFFVPTKARNPEGGMEFLRLMFSRRAAGHFAELTGALSTVAGAGERATGGTGFASTRAMVEAAGENTVHFRFNIWYLALYRAAGAATGDLLHGRITTAEWSDRIQRVADETAADPSITKFRR
ncbi:N-acetylglucosamine/diacetylchitobiose ABC transporter substrate-binding protein [Longispora sp. K20-0274]|uniref:N-acetylglucosamine/diacetylchitobiose ABC transporter substrate-binding protein n=1 Tax=Longispora sp. K20-0274 TaxID=3088255 RepID=UPI00399A536A